MNQNHFSAEDLERLKTLGKDFERWLNEHIEAGNVSVGGLVHLTGLIYLRLRTTLTVEQLEDMVSEQFLVMEHMLQEGLIVNMGPDLDEPMRMPTVETYEANPGLRDMFLALNKHADLDSELDALLEDNDEQTD